MGYLIASLRGTRETHALQVALEGERARRLKPNCEKESERIAALEQAETRLRGTFDSLAGESLRANSEMFLRLARETLRRDQARCRRLRSRNAKQRSRSWSSH